MTLLPSTRRAAILGLLLLSLLSAWWWSSFRQRTKKQEPVPFPALEAKPSGSHSNSIDGPLLPALADPDNATIQGEAIWRIRTAADRDHLARALQNGLRLVRQIDPLGVVLMAGPPGLLRDWSQAALEAGSNVHLYLPPIPDSPNLEGTRSFENQLLSYLGIEDRLDQWGKGIRIAILDTGIAPHASLASADISLMRSEGTATPVDENGHGTAVASLIAGNDNFAQGLAPAAELLVYPVLDAMGRGDAFGIAAAIVSAVDHGAQIISISAGSATEAPVLREAVAYAAARDVVIVAAAGNDNSSQALYPAAYETVIAVGAIDANGNVAHFSNSGPTLDLAAPGVGIYSAYLENHYIQFSGTSAATPIVAGAIAAIASVDSILSVRQAADALQAYADDAGAPGWDPQMGHGILDPIRVINRNDPNFSDLGVSSPHLVPTSSQDSTVMVSINVQNRGNQYIARATATIEIDGLTSTQIVPGLETGASIPISVELSSAQLRSENGVTLEVKVTPGSGQSDTRSANNGYSTHLRLEPKP